MRCHRYPLKQARHFEGQHKKQYQADVDLSGSTNGLIDDVREQLWMIINQAHELSPEIGRAHV